MIDLEIAWLLLPLSLLLLSLIGTVYCWLSFLIHHHLASWFIMIKVWCYSKSTITTPTKFQPSIAIDYALFTTKNHWFIIKSHCHSSSLINNDCAMVKRVRGRTRNCSQRFNNRKRCRWHGLGCPVRGRCGVWGWISGKKMLDSEGQLMDTWWFIGEKKQQQACWMIYDRLTIHG